MPRYGICFTLNNYTTEEVHACETAVGNRGIKYIIWGCEIAPNTGTPHLQGYMQTNDAHFDRIKTLISSRLHLERQKGDSRQAVDYCKKDGQWEEHGSYVHIAAPAERQGKRKDLDAVKEAIDAGKTFDEIVETHFATVARCERFIKQRITDKQQKDSLVKRQESFSSAVLRPWQLSLDARVQRDPHPRKVIWIWDAVGNKGKSWMAGYLEAVRGAMVLDAGKKGDLAYILCSQAVFPKIVVFDLSRTMARENDRYDPMTSIYALAEGLKNGRLTSTKYESRVAYFENPHVIFFANFEPDQTKMSADRWKIKCLD